MAKTWVLGIDLTPVLVCRCWGLTLRPRACVWVLGAGELMLHLCFFSHLFKRFFEAWSCCVSWAGFKLISAALTSAQHPAQLLQCFQGQDHGGGARERGCSSEEWLLPFQSTQVGSPTTGGSQPPGTPASEGVCRLIPLRVEQVHIPLLL